MEMAKFLAFLNFNMNRRKFLLFLKGIELFLLLSSFLPYFYKNSFKIQNMVI